MRVRLLGQVVGGERPFNGTGKGVLFSGLKSSARVDRGMQLAYRVRAWRVTVSALLDGERLQLEGTMFPDFAGDEREMAFGPESSFSGEATGGGFRRVEVSAFFPVQSVMTNGDEASVCLEFQISLALYITSAGSADAVLYTLGLGSNDPLTDYSADIAGEVMPFYSLLGELPPEVEDVTCSFQPAEYWEFRDSNGANPIFHPATGEALMPPKQGDISL